jgi:GalNAc5-diNAcBac-PP-undecaprenol beta-1,3-glucosyltransferase
LTPVLSIIVTTFKRPTELARCLESVGKATSSRPQLIVVDDSPDGEGFPVATRFGGVYIGKGGHQRRGPAASRNLGLAIAEGRYVAFLDDDDCFAERGLDALLTASNGGDFVFGNYSDMANAATGPVDLSTVSYDTLLVSNSIPIGAFIIQRSSIRYPFDEHLRSHEDWDFLLKNVSPEGMTHVPSTVVAITTSAAAESYSVRDQAKRHYWLDFLSIYARHPAPHVAAYRAAAMARLGIDLPEEILRIEPRFPADKSKGSTG